MATEPRRLQAKATRNGFLEAVYGAGLVRTGDEISRWADKFFQFEQISAWAPSALRFWPHTERWSFVAGTPSPRDFLHARFSRGYVVKPAVGHSGEGLNVLERVESLLAKPPAEEWIVQDKIVGPSGQWGPGSPDEFRVHTFGDRVVEGATFSRWDLFWNDDLFREVEAGVQDFLRQGDRQFWQGHAWGLDVIRTSPGTVRIIDLNNNRGEARQWSGDLSIPDVLGAYVRHLERYHQVFFEGDAGVQLRTDQANHEKWRLKVGESAVRRHEELRRHRR